MTEPEEGNPPPKNRKITVRDVAAELGLHFTTVAAALRDSPKVKSETKERVNEVAKKLGYRADPMLTALAAYRTGTKAPAFQGVLAWINLFDSPTFFSDSKIGFYSNTYSGAAKRAEVLGYRLESFWMNEPGMTAKRASQILENRNVAGVIVGPMPHGTDELHLFWEKFCSVRIGYSLKDAALSRVTPDQFGNMKLIFKRLWDDGFRRIGFTSPKRMDNRANNHWSGAFCAMQLHYLGEIDIAPHLSEDKEEGFIEWYHRYRPEVIITSVLGNHLTALKKNGIAVPNETQLVSLHVDADDSHTSSPGIRQNSTIVGRTSVDNLVAIIHRLKAGIENHPKTITITGKWQDGETYDPTVLKRQ